MRLIDADLMIVNGFKDKTIEVRTEDIIEKHEKVVKLLFKDALEFIKKQPTVDAVERKRGRWIKMSDADGIYFACSICGENLPRIIQRFDPQFDLFPRLESIDKTKYCPNCGADMRGEEE